MIDTLLNLKHNFYELGLIIPLFFISYFYVQSKNEMDLIILCILGILYIAVNIMRDSYLNLFKHKKLTKLQKKKLTKDYLYILLVSLLVIYMTFSWIFSVVVIAEYFAEPEIFYAMVIWIACALILVYKAYFEKKMQTRFSNHYGRKLFR